MEDGSTPLYIACQNGHNSVVEMLLKKGVNIEVAIVDGSTPLHIACKNGHHEVVQILLENKSNIETTC